MDEVTQQNAALVEEAAAAAESLEDQTRALSQAVAMFRLETESSRSLHRRGMEDGGGGQRSLAAPQLSSDAPSTLDKPVRAMNPILKVGAQVRDEDQWEAF